MNSNPDTGNKAIRDYTKPIMPRFRGKEGYKAYVKIVTTPPVRYDAAAESAKAAEFLRKQGLNL